jgi:hypothetical protein
MPEDIENILKTTNNGIYNEYINWTKAAHNFVNFHFQCETRNMHEITKCLKSDEAKNSLFAMTNLNPGASFITPFKLAMYPSNYPKIFSPAQIASYTNDGVSKLIKQCVRWTPRYHKYWPFKFREFVKHTLMIHNRLCDRIATDTTAHSVSKNAFPKEVWFQVLGFLGRNDFKDYLVQIPKHGPCITCGKPTLNRCSTCRKYGNPFNQYFCSIKCQKYDWKVHKQIHKLLGV